MESVWLVAFSSAVTAQNIYDKIRPHIDNNDFLLIVEVTNSNRQGWLAKDVWKWWHNGN